MTARGTKHCRQYAQSAAVRRLTAPINHVHGQLAVSVDLITEGTVYTTLCLTAAHTAYAIMFRCLHCNTTQYLHLQRAHVQSLGGR